MKNLSMKMATEEEREARDAFGDDRLMCLFYENGTYVGYVWYDYLANDDRTLYIEFIKAEQDRQGYGLAMLHWLFDNMDIDAVYGETDEYNKDFWATIGAEVSDDYVDDVREMYDFTLRRAAMAA